MRPAGFLVFIALIGCAAPPRDGVGLAPRLPPPVEAARVESRGRWWDGRLRALDDAGYAEIDLAVDVADLLAPVPLRDGTAPPLANAKGLAAFLVLAAGPGTAAVSSDGRLTCAVGAPRRRLARALEAVRAEMPVYVQLELRGLRRSLARARALCASAGERDAWWRLDPHEVHGLVVEEEERYDRRWSIVVAALSGHPVEYKFAPGGEVAITARAHVGWRAVTLEGDRGSIAVANGGVALLPPGDGLPCLLVCPRILALETPGREPLRAALGCLERGDRDGARAAFEELARREPGHPAAALGLGR